MNSDLEHIASAEFLPLLTNGTEESGNATPEQVPSA